MSIISTPPSPLPETTDATSQRSSASSEPPKALGLPTALKPIGLHNEQNTCFFNSTFQALSATAPLISLLSSSLTPSPTALLPHTPVPSSLIPSLLPSASEPPQYELLPVTRAFLASLSKSWLMKDAGGGTTGSTETSPTRSMSLRNLMKEIARKYDQYDDYRQQDAEELFRHLLDSMEMEERDLIKVLQPPPAVMKKPKKKRSYGSSPQTLLGVTTEGTEVDGTENQVEAQQEEVCEIPENERLVPFVKALFGGSLASVVVCESCKSVSHTYEGFLDISLSLKGDEPKARKRDRFKAMAQKLRPRGSTGTKQSESERPSSSTIPAGVVSDTETSDHEGPDGDRRKSLDQDDTLSIDTTLSRNGSSKTFGLRSKPSFSFRRKGSRPGSVSSATSIADSTAPSTRERSRSPVATSASAISVGSSRPSHAKPTAAQSAYIQRILAAPTQADFQQDPLARLRAANSGAAEGLKVSVQDCGLIESLKQFTAVEVLEGENAFACKKCWKIKSGKYVGGHETVQEENEEEDLFSADTSPALTARSTLSPAPPTISIAYSEDAVSEPASPVAESRMGRTPSLSSFRSLPVRAPSPLRSHVTLAQSDPSTLTEFPPDGLSDTDSSEDEEGDVGEGPPAVSRTNSTNKHVVMRRAFKRYLIDTAPEVLVFHFKRFKQTHKTSMTFSSFYNLKKMDDFVSFPETLDLAPFLAPNRSDYRTVQTPTGPHANFMDWASPEQGPELTPVNYKLYGGCPVRLQLDTDVSPLISGVVVHLGTMLGGHYVAYCLVDPLKMFQLTSPDGAMAGLSIADRPRKEKEKDRRVWCYCSE
ncbi:hypothetical protein P7C73_g6422, partial [Tremellales sp. Uapishka_1]